jgi:hypothetical protein
MAIFGTKSDIDGILEGAAKHEQERRHQFEAQLEESRGAALANGVRLLALFELLPKAMLASQHAERERVAARLGRNHPRVRDLEASIREIERSEGLAKLGRERVARFVQGIERGGTEFHGFVYDRAGQPLPGMTVRLRIGRRGDKSAAKTEADGYFRIPLLHPDAEETGRGGKESARGEKEGATKTKSAARAGASKETEGEVATVEVLDSKGKVAFTDPTPLVLGDRGAYREYVVDPEKTRPSKPRRPRGKAADRRPPTEPEAAS